MLDALIDVQDLRKTYREGVFRRRNVEALRGATFQVQPGEIFGLLGPNGAGKTTLIKILLGIVGRSAGSASLLGRPVGDRRVRRRVGYLPESHRIPRHLTGHTALDYYGGLSGLSTREIRARRGGLLERVGLADWGTTSVRKYSKGMLQRLGLAQAMLHEPELLILDEPTDGVDPVGRTEIRKVLKELKARGTTVFLNSHLLQEIELVCDRAAILIGGKVRRAAPIDELTRSTATAVVLELIGAEDRIRETLAPFALTHCTPLAENRFTAVCALTDQPALDACLDALRAAGISVCRLTGGRQTLEEAFMELVRQGDAENPPEMSTHQ